MSLARSIRQNASRRDLVICGVALLVSVAIVWFAALRSRSVKVHLVNGLDVLVEVEVDGRKVDVFPGSHTMVQLPTQVVQATTRTGGRVLETVAIDGSGAPSAVVYNVLGAAPVLLVDITYTASSASSDHEPSIQALVGDRVHVVQDLDYAFEAPPRSISTKSSGNVHKKALLLGGLENRGDWSFTTGYLLRQDRNEDALAVVRRVVEAQLEKPERPIGYAHRVATKAYGPGALLPVVAGVVAHAPTPAAGESRTYLPTTMTWDACALGRCDRAQATLAAAPMDPLARSLAELRTLPRDRFEAALAKLSAEHPKDPEVLRVAAWSAATQARWEECAARYTEIGAALPAQRLPDKAVCLFAAGRFSKDVLAGLEKEATSHLDTSWYATITYARILHASVGHGSPVDVDKLAPKETPLPAFRTMMALEMGTLTASGEAARGELEKEDRSLDRATAAARKALSGPVSALTAFEAIGADASAAPAPLLLVIGGEAARQGNVALARRLVGAAANLAIPADDAIAYVIDGVESPAFFRLDAEERAALDLARARRLAVLGHDPAAAYASIRKRDVLRGWVTRLLDTWHDPDPGDDVLTYEAR